MSGISSAESTPTRTPRSPRPTTSALLSISPRRLSCECRRRPFRRSRRPPRLSCTYLRISSSTSMSAGIAAFSSYLATKATSTGFTSSSIARKQYSMIAMARVGRFAIYFLSNLCRRIAIFIPVGEPVWQRGNGGLPVRLPGKEICRYTHANPSRVSLVFAQPYFFP